MGSALVWGALAASSLVIGALLGLARKWPDKWVGLVLAFGAGALVSSVSFELAEEGLDVGSGLSVGIGLAVGAVTYWGLNREVDRRSGGSAPGPRWRWARSSTASRSSSCWASGSRPGEG